MKKYIRPNLQIELFITEDIMTDSGNVSNDPKKLRQSTHNAGSTTYSALVS